uniref:AP2/ERF transcription factor n=1 Tax=Camptotheca acuminata TaxID=16922 RepID=A0A7G8AUB6_CAMAC|nr:AP2/ERF transcription factor [Camptotheca acuminata]
MNISSPYSDPYPFGSNFCSGNRLETSSFSDAHYRTTTHSSNEVILASSRPKRRAGRKKFKETRHPVYRGVRKRNGNRWVCELREPNKKSRIWLGTYPTAEMAARAHDVAALALKGELACLNFADSTWRLPLPASKDARDIRRAATEAAESFRPREHDSDQRQESAKASHGTSSSDGGTENVRISRENVFYIDEEAIFDMPGLLVNMAEGLLISPPCLGESFSCNDMESDPEVSLWS